MTSVSRCVRVASLFAFSLLSLTGCESRVALSGKVLENGQPLPEAELRWVGDNSFASGASDASGAYVLDAGGKKDIPVGKYEVTVSWWRGTDGKPLPQGEAGSAMKSKQGAAVQYSATVSVEVTSSTKTLDLDVTGKGKAIDPNQ